ncbi:MAG TPA: serine hydrolase [Flavobacteriales bacterium]|nr:serine hydrolase [Flavobacteriales bacterium]
MKLDDDITKHIPEFNAQGKRVTVEMLLNHTSGIKSYTDMEEFHSGMQRKDMKPEEIMAFFQDQPFDFEPGTAWRYNNSGYVLLGILIERVTGWSYAEYVEQEFFMQLGMKHSRYGSDEAIVAGRVSGYIPDGTDFQNAAYLSLSWPYAAGSLFSNVDDLHTWTRAVHAGKLVRAETLERAHISAKLPNGKDTRYGFGWSIGAVQGVPSVEHGGGINGFVTHALYLPLEELFVAVLTNLESGVAPDLCAKLAATAIGKPYSMSPIAVDAKTLASFEGVYADDGEGERYLRVVNGKLISQRKGGSVYTLVPIGKDLFAFESSLTRMTFRRDKKGRVAGLTMHDRSFGDSEWTRTSKPLPEPPKEVTVTEQQLNLLLGEYELAPGFIMSVTREGSQVFIQATGQQRIQAYPKSPEEFFLKVVDARIVFNLAADGKAESLVLHQGGQEMRGPRVK